MLPSQTDATITNHGDIVVAGQDGTTASYARLVIVDNAIVDPASSHLGLPTSLIVELGLLPRGELTVTLRGKLVTLPTYDPVRLELWNRSGVVVPVELPDGAAVVIGTEPLQMLGCVVETLARK